MILDEIVAKKKETLASGKATFDLKRLIEILKEVKIASFKDAIAKPGLSIIGEIKKASPSRGLIKPDFNPIALAKEYEWAVDAISVLTEEHFFQGSPDYLKQVHETVLLPVLRKDFIISPLQIFEARELGASAVLLIAAILEKNILRDYLQITHGLGMDAIVEVHNEKELETALCVKADIIGINNRNLVDFTEDIQTTVKLRKHIPEEILVISESSIHTGEDIQILKKANINGILVGESFMKSGEIRLKAREFRDAYDA